MSALQQASKRFFPPQVLKLYAWEASFADQVKHTRKKELRLLKELSILQSFNGFLFLTTPLLVSVCYLLSVLLESTIDLELASIYNFFVFLILSINIQPILTWSRKRALLGNHCKNQWLFLSLPMHDLLSCTLCSLKVKHCLISVMFWCRGSTVDDHRD